MTPHHAAILETTRPSMCVFCGSSSAVDKHYVKLAQKAGQAIAQAGYRLVYGGGGIGLMGALARSAYEHKGEVVGIIPNFLQTAEVVYKDVPHIVVEDMHSRKSMMYEAADAFLILPGGLGTLEEAIEVISWLRMDLHSKPIVFVDTNGYWRPLLSLIRHTIDARFTPEWVNHYLFEVSDPIDALHVISREIGPKEFHDLKRKIPKDKV